MRWQLPTQMTLNRKLNMPCCIRKKVKRPSYEASLHIFNSSFNFLMTKMS